MLVVYLLPHGGSIWSFQMPWRFAGCVPGRERTDHQVPPVLDVERGERRIGRLWVGGDALVGRQVGVAAPAEIDAQAIEQALVLGDMSSPDIQPRLTDHTRGAHRQGGVGIAADIVEDAEAGCRVDDDERLVGALYPQRRAGWDDGAADGA